MSTDKNREQIELEAINSLKQILADAPKGHAIHAVTGGAAAPRSRSERMKGIVSARIPGDQGGAKHPLPSTEPRDADDIPTLLDPKPGC